MTDDLVKRWDDYVESMGSVMGDVEHMAQQMRQRIEALTAERDALQAENEIYRAALNEIETAPEPDHWVPQYQHCVDTAELALAEAISARAALNTGKEVMPDATQSPPAGHDIGPGDRAVAGAAPDPVVVAAEFALAIILKWEADNLTYDTERDWYGHVRPALTRLKAALTGKEPSHD